MKQFYIDELMKHFSPANLEILYSLSEDQLEQLFTHYNKFKPNSYEDAFSAGHAAGYKDGYQKGLSDERNKRTRTIRKMDICYSS